MIEARAKQLRSADCGHSSRRIELEDGRTAAVLDRRDSTAHSMVTEEIQTRVDRPRALERVEREPRPTPAGALEPLEAMRDDELARFCRMSYPALVVAMAALLCMVPFLPGDPVARRLFAGGLVTYAAGGTWLRFRVRDPTQFNEANLVVIAISGVIAACATVYYWGVFSPAPIAVAAVVFMACLDGGVPHAAIAYAACAIVQAAVSIAIITGMIEDRGLIQADYATSITQVITQIVIQCTLLAAFVGGRTMRRITKDSIIQLDRAARETAKREALIEEIRQEVERAAGANRQGRYSDHILGSFRIGLVIGRGAMGEVYEARHVHTNKPAAVKVLLMSHLGNPEYLERFAREARAVAALDSPHVVRILEVGESGKIPYLAMERLEGVELAAWLRGRRQLPQGEVVTLVGQIASGLEVARRRGIVHRDLKPHNVFCSHRDDGAPLWKILDFGVSKLADHGGSLTHDRVVGTPAYMAPEQACGRDVDHRADVYGLGAIAYRALTGQSPFTVRGTPNVLFDVAYRVPPRPGSLASLPAAVEDVLAVALAKNPDDRFTTANELADALRAAYLGTPDPQLAPRAARILDAAPWGALLRPEDEGR